MDNIEDIHTSEAFSNSWVNCFSSSPYALRQVREWLSPVALEGLSRCRVCELGCGNGGLLQHVAPFSSEKVTGVDLGRSVEMAKQTFREMGINNVDFIREDIFSFSHNYANAFDFVYCIGVLHHMKNPGEGFQAVVRATRPGGRFHCWVYGYEGNLLIRTCVEPLRRITSKLPWWLNKYAVALPLSVPFFMVSQIIKLVSADKLHRYLPLYEYFMWIGDYSFSFHHHVVFDQLVSPQTIYIKKEVIENWLCQPELENTYIVSRNANSWKFGGVKKKQ